MRRDSALNFLRRQIRAAKVAVLMVLWRLSIGTLASAQDFWHATNGLLNDEVWSLAVQLHGNVFAGTGDGKIFRSTDTGENWEQVGSLSNARVRSFVFNMSGHIFAGTQGGGLFRSTDNGVTWTRLNISHNNILSLAINPAQTIFAGTEGGGIFRSMNNGSNWRRVLLTNTVVPALAINANGHVFAGTEGDGVFRSMTNGDDWPPVNAGLTNQTIQALAINPVTQELFAGTTAGVFISTNNGDAWKPRSTGLTNPVVRSLVGNASGHIFAGTNSGGVFRTTDSGENWTAVNSGLANFSIFALVINSEGDIFAGTLGKGVFRAIAPRVNDTSSSSVRAAGNNIPITANIVFDKGVGSATVHYRKGGEIDFNTATMSKMQGDVFEGSIPGTAVTSKGVEYFIMAANAGGHLQQEPATGIFSIQVRVDSERNPEVLLNGAESTAYRLVSVPMQLEDSSAASVLLDDLGKYDRKKWRLFGLGNGQDLVEFPDAGDFALGRSLFLIVKDPGKVIDAGPGQSIKTDREFTMTLKPGHNLIASPFNFNIPASKLRLASGDSIKLCTYKGEWIPANELSPWEGNYLANNRSVNDTLFVNPELSSVASSSSPPVSKASERAWRIQILATCGEARDTQNFAGVVSESSDEWDVNDWVEPPPIGEYVSLYFPHQEWEKVLSRYSHDLRSPERPNQRWDFDVESNITGEVITLRFDQVEDIPNELSAYLVDFALGHKQNLRENAAYQFRAPEPDHPKELSFIVGKEEFIAQQTAEIPEVPSDFVLYQNFPNPFNPATTIRYGLPRTERVTLKVYNLIGEEVVTLVNDAKKEAGYHISIWDGRNKNGNIVASGVYVYRIRAGSFSMTKKLVMIK